MWLYALTTVVSAFLLFQVQPIIAKCILPWFGGSAGVWTVCLLFFQLVLLLGYLYAHAMVRYFEPQIQKFLHGTLLLASLLVLPIYPRLALKPGPGSDPTWGILSLLALTVGLPYFLLSTTGPLLQAWYARTHKGAVPYRLYALSNAGSMFALLSYPVLVEPTLTTHQQTGTWSIAYGVFAILCGLTALRMSNYDVLAEDPLAASAPPPAARQYILWLLLPATASLLLLAITNHLSQNVAAIPFLWIVPLSLYLLSFILCFEGSGWYRRNPYLQLLAVAVGGMGYAMIRDSHSANMPILVNIVLFGLGLFTCCMVCHGELVRLKPHPKYLTHFYLMISAGGALGGIFVGLLAPRIFHSFYELQFGLVLCPVLILFALSLDPETAPDPVRADPLLDPRRPAPAPSAISRFFRPLVLAARRIYRYRWMTMMFAGAAATVVMAVYLGKDIRENAEGSRVLVRNFYGSLRVQDDGTEDGLESKRTLTNGTINHGNEYLNIAKRRMPTTYYGPHTGVGIAIKEKQKKGAIRVGVVGLGTGTVAAYGRLGDYYRYYEINPNVPPITKGQFFFVPTCPAKLDIAMGDARLSLEREAPENFDVLAVDAFSSDAIPVHLLTKEAMQLYFRHLQPDGVLAVHISNRYLDLQPVVEGEAQSLGKLTRTIDNDDDDSIDEFSSTWVLVFAPDSGFQPWQFLSSADIKSRRKVRLWTDDYSDLFRIVKQWW